ncbi:MAG TPA: MFS transporter, partial [Chryseosolibacter sp.]|nr:MFS transporter [Chryseosolibacter sp.]
IGVILAVRESLGVSEFNDWGWRIPFLISAVLVGVSIYIRLKMSESPLFSKIKSEGKISKNPLKESFGKKENLKLVLIALFGATAGQGVVWYTGQFYAMTFIENTCKVEFIQTRNIIAIALVIGTPLFIYFGWLSDRMGRKMIMMIGMLAAVFLYRPIYKQMYEAADVKNKTELPGLKVIDRSSSKNEQGVLITTSKATNFYEGGNRMVKTSFYQGDSDKPAEEKTEILLGDQDFWMMVMLVLIQVVLVTMVYGPIAAFLVELFPTKIRYTSMSLPYHIGNGIFGGLVPFIATSLYEMSKTDSNPTGDPFAGLWYPIIVSAVCFTIGMIYLSNRKKADVLEDT